MHELIGPIFLNDFGQTYLIIENTDAVIAQKEYFQKMYSAKKQAYAKEITSFIVQNYAL